MKPYDSERPTRCRIKIKTIGILDRLLAAILAASFLVGQPSAVMRAMAEAAPPALLDPGALPAGPAAWTDRADYAPGSTATFGGRGFLAGEALTLQVTHTDGHQPDEPEYRPWNVLADADGAFTSTWQVCVCVGERLLLTVTGQISCLQAQVLFTDSTGASPTPGDAVSWGYGYYGQLGDGTFRTSPPNGASTPVAVAALPDGRKILAIAGGNLHTLALANDGTLWAWGFAGYGQLGNGTFADSSTPVQVDALPDGRIATAISGRYLHNLVLANDGTLWAWGDGGSGQTGNGTFANSNTPVAVVGLPAGKSVLAISVGFTHSLAILGTANSAPVANPDSFTTAEDTTLNVAAPGLMANDSDANGDSSTVTTYSAPASGALSMYEDGSFAYTPMPNFNGTDSFTYTIDDGKGGTATATVSIAVTPVNDAPLAVAQSVTTDEDTPIVITLSGSDPDGDSLIFLVATHTGHGTLSGTAPNLIYTPDANYSGPDSFTFSVSESPDLLANTGHFYEFVAAPGFTWTQARNAAAARMRFGMRGYLATITSAAENGFIAPKLQGTGIAWIGGNDEATEGVWRWMTGPEAGQQFWSASGAVAGAYGNWGIGEPNDYFGFHSENYAALHVNLLGRHGSWLDVPHDGYYDVVGYVVEYGGLPDDNPSGLATASVSIAVIPVNDPPVLATPIPNQSGNYGDAFSYTVLTATFVDPDAGQTLASSASGLPSGLSFDGASRNFSGTPTQVGTFSVTVTVTDNGSPVLSASTSFDLVIGTATPAIAWQPGNITYPMPLDSVWSLNARADVPGTFVYDPPAGTVFPVGSHLLSVTFTPIDTAHYRIVGATASLRVDPGYPVLTWPDPADIVDGTPLGAAQLNATTTVPGTFTYDPPAGTIFHAGTYQLWVDFVPADTNYLSNGRPAHINVLRTPPHFVLQWGSQGSDDGQFQEPTGIAVDADGDVYVAQRFDERIQKFDSQGRFIAKWGSHGSGPGQFFQPDGIAIGSDGAVFVADYGNRRIQKFDAHGAFLRVIGTQGSGPGQWSDPTGLATDSAGNLYVADAGNNRITKLDPEGNFLASWGSSGSGPGKFISPLGVAVDGNGRVYVLDFNNRRVQVFDTEGTFLAAWGPNPAGDETFEGLLGIAAGPNGDVYLTRSANARRIQQFDGAGRLLTRWGDLGFGPGQITGAHGIAVDAHGNIYVADLSGHRVQKFSYFNSPTVVAPINSSLPENQPVGSLVGQLSATDTDPADAIAYSLVSGAGDEDNGAFTIVGDQLQAAATFDYETKNSYRLRVRATDSHGLANDRAFTIAVLNVNEAPVAVADDYAVDQRGTLQVAEPGVLANDSDEDANTLAALAGNGPIHGTLTLNSNGAFEYTPTPLFVGIDSFTYLVSDGDGGSSSAMVTIAVNPVDRDGDGYPIDFDCDDDDPTVNPVAPELIDGKDNNCDGLLDGGATAPQGNNIVATPIDPATGTTPVTLVFPEVGQGGTTTLEIDNTGALPPNNFKLGQPPIYYELSTTALFSGPVSVCFRYSEGSFFNEQTARLFHFENGHWQDITFSRDTVNNVICGQVASFSPFAIFEQENRPPAIAAVTGPTSPIALGATANLTVTYSDPDSQDTHTVRFSWDDGTPDTVISGNAGSATASHAYAAPGVQSIGVTVTDNRTGTVSRPYEYVVVYDPSGGFVTGAGWIQSPAGAYHPDPELTGTAVFGFVSRYKKGLSVPTGVTEYYLHAGQFNFLSTSCDWLVVVGHKAQYRGTGKINGAGNYGFILTATDGNISGGGGTDRFRLRIWDKNTGQAVYDNRRAVSDDIDAADPQQIGGGSIVIHKPK